MRRRYLNIVVGPANSGKTTYIREHRDNKDLIISADNYKIMLFNRYNLSEYEKDQLWERINLKLEAKLREGQRDIWLDATSRDINDRIDNYNLAHKYNYKVNIYWFIYSLPILLERNIKSKKNIEPDFIKNQFLVIDPPKYKTDCDFYQIIREKDDFPKDEEEFNDRFIYPMKAIDKNDALYNKKVNYLNICRRMIKNFK